MARRFKTKVQLDSGLVIPAGAAVGRVLTSDASGNGTWGALITRYPLGALPISAPNGTLAIIELVSAAEIDCLARYSTSANGWAVLGYGRVPSAIVSPSISGPASGWRKPSPNTLSLGLPYAGDWWLHCEFAAQASAADPNVGVGMAKSTDAGNLVTIGNASASVYTANARVRPVIDGIITATAAGEVWDMRVYTGLSNTLSFVGCLGYAQPQVLKGVV